MKVPFIFSQNNSLKTIQELKVNYLIGVKNMTVQYKTIKCTVVQLKYTYRFVCIYQRKYNGTEQFYSL